MVTIFERYQKGIQIGFENPAEIDYNRKVSSINLHNLGAVIKEDNASAIAYFNTQPMLILEYDGKSVKMIRGNQSFRQLCELHPEMIKVGHEVAVRDMNSGLAQALLKAIHSCEEEGQRVFIDEVTDDGEAIHALLRRVMNNPVTGTVAFAMAILGISDKDGEKGSLLAW